MKISKIFSWGFFPRIPLVSFGQVGLPQSILPSYARYCTVQTKSQIVWFLSWKTATKIIFLSAWNHCFISKKIKRGENEATDTFIAKFPTKRVENSSVPTFTHEWLEVSKVERYLFSKKHFLVKDDKHVILQVYARFWKMPGLVWSRQNTNHCSTKLALIFSWIEQYLHDYI